jgi:bifunctional DNase/RNase
MVEMVVHTMVKDSAKQMVVVLKEREGKRALPIVIGPCEATAIAASWRNWRYRWRE